MSWLNRTNLRASFRKKISSAAGQSNLYQDSGGYSVSKSNGNSPQQQPSEERTESFEDFCKVWQICYEVIANSESTTNSHFSRGCVGTVTRCLSSLVNSLCNEFKDMKTTQCLDMVLNTDLIGKIVTWSQSSAEYIPELRIELLRAYENLLLAVGAKFDSSSSDPVGRESALLSQEEILKPLLTLMYGCSENGQLLEVEKRLISLLNLLVVAVVRDPTLLDKFFDPATAISKPRFIIFELLVPFVHREGLIGQQARDSLILCLSLAKERPYLGYFIAEHSNFNPVLATGLSGLYSALPRQLPEGVEARGWLSTEDINSIPELSNFVASLEFCSSALMSCNEPISAQLTEYVYQGFLVPVMGPALHQNTVREITAATCYFNLSLKRIANRALLGAFLRFLVVEKYEGQCVMDSLVMRIMAKPKALCLATLTLLLTLVTLHCEDVMLFLVFRELLTGKHLLTSEDMKPRPSLVQSADRFLSLVPRVRAKGAGVPANGTDTGIDASEYYTPDNTRVLESSMISDADRTREYITPTSSPSKSSENRKESFISALLSTPNVARKIYEDVTSSPIEGYKPPADEQLAQFHCYLLEARSRISSSMKSTQCWTYKYDWNHPSISESKRLLRERISTPKRRKLSVPLPKEEKQQVELKEPSDKEFFEDPIVQNKSDLLYQEAMDQLTTILQEMNVRSPSESSGYESFNMRAEPFSLDLDSNFMSDNLQQQLEFWSMMREDSEETTTEQFEQKEDLIEEVEDEGIEADPDIGNFLTLLLYRVDSWLSNDLSINLIVTSVLSCLATYPQPVLRDFLLDTKLVTQPSVTTLPQVLAAVKHRLEAFLGTRKNVENVIEEAKLELSSVADKSVGKDPKNVTPRVQEKKRSFTSALQSIFRRNTTGSPAIEPDIPESVLEGIPDRYHNKTTEPIVPEQTSEDILYYRHVAKCAVLFEEWVKELAALSLEHNIAIVDQNFPKFG